MPYGIVYDIFLSDDSERQGETHMILYHAGKETVEFPEIRKTRYTKDFSWGFYCKMQKR